MDNTLHPEPSAYDYIFYFSKTELIATIIIPLFLGSGLCYWSYMLLLDKNYGGIIPSFIGLGLLYLSVIQGWIPLINMQPQIKLSRAGIWTKKLGFKPWADINNIAVVKLGKPSYGGPAGGLRTYLKIYLGQNTDNKNPDDSIFIDNIKDRDKINQRITELRSKN